MINSFIFENENVPLLIPSELIEGINTYTVLIGKNGAGKSRLLRMLSDSLSFDYPIKNELDRKQMNLTLERGGKVIAVSTSPFDQFKAPIPQHLEARISNYRYVGIKASPSSRSTAIGLLSSATAGLLDAFIDQKNRNNLSSVFVSLEFSPEFRLYFKMSNRYSGSGRMRRREEVPHNFRYITELGFDIGERECQLISMYSEEDQKNLEYNLKSIFSSHDPRSGLKVDFDLKLNRIYQGNKHAENSKEFAKAISLMLEIGLLRLLDIKINKYYFGEMSLRRASSGEQCMLVIMLGIAGHITNNSYIFIDEPEISLHPEWQDKFMILLSEAFSPYQSCQFIIATHSPQIAANLYEKNSFVTTLEDRKIHSPSKFHNKSSDFLLAELFNTPGHKNEYIIRRIITLIANVKDQKNISDENKEEFKHLERLTSYISDSDPTHDLLKVFNTLNSLYGSH